MQDKGKEGELRPQKPYRISSYRDGIYQPNGYFIREPLLSAKAIDRWEDDNMRVFDGKQWGKGQALFFIDKSSPLVFGRHSDRCDVKIDEDPTSDGLGVSELGVSRRHFQIKFIAADRLEIKDLGSHNGLRIYNIKDRARQIKLGKGSIDSAQLEIGDFVLLGGGGSGGMEEQGRLIGFTVCRDKNNEIFLVKFNAQNEDDLLAIIGVVKERPGSESFGENEMVRGILGGLIEDLKGVKQFETQGPNSPEALDSLQKYLLNVLGCCRILGNKYHQGDWKNAATIIGLTALTMGEDALSDGKKQDASRFLEISSYMNQIAAGGILPRVKDE